MLVRRFTIVCVLMSLFGMAFAILVAEASRTNRPNRIAKAMPCITDGADACRYASR